MHRYGNYFFVSRLTTVGKMKCTSKGGDSGITLIRELLLCPGCTTVGKMKCMPKGERRDFRSAWPLKKCWPLAGSPSTPTYRLLFAFRAFRFFCWCGLNWRFCGPGNFPSKYMPSTRSQEALAFRAPGGGLWAVRLHQVVLRRLRNYVGDVITAIVHFKLEKQFYFEVHISVAPPAYYSTFTIHTSVIHTVFTSNIYIYRSKFPVFPPAIPRGQAHTGTIL